MAAPLDYAPLPRGVQERVLKSIDTLTVNGAKISAEVGRAVAEGAAHIAVDAGQHDGRPGSGNLGDRIFNGTLWILGRHGAGGGRADRPQPRAGLARPAGEGAQPLGLRHRRRVESGRGALRRASVPLRDAGHLGGGDRGRGPHRHRARRSSSPSSLLRSSAALLTVPVELLAAIPSVVYGLWGLFVVVPWLRESIEPWLGAHLGFLPLFQGPPIGLGYLAAGLILAVMILPTIVAVSVEVMKTTPGGESRGRARAGGDEVGGGDDGGHSLQPGGHRGRRPPRARARAR